MSLVSCSFIVHCASLTERNIVTLPLSGPICDRNGLHQSEQKYLTVAHVTKNPCLATNSVNWLVKPSAVP